MSREEITCAEPLLTVDRQMGLNIVHPEGKVYTFNVLVLEALLMITLGSEDDIQSHAL